MDPGSEKPEENREPEVTDEEEPGEEEEDEFSEPFFV